MDIKSSNFSISYGDMVLSLPFLDHMVELQLRDPEKKISPAFFLQQLNVILQETPLDLSRTILVVADKTRVCGYQKYLPLLINTLESHGMDRSRLKIIIAYGTHARQSEDECLQSYGEVYKMVSFIHHDCHNPNHFEEMGQTSRGTPIRHRKDLLAASAVITMGPVCHHYFAGFGGGRKLIFPGCGERESIFANHSLYLDHTAGTLSPKCQPGILTGNPIAEDLFEIEEKLSAHLSIHGILDSHGNVFDFLIGRGRKPFLDACALHGLTYEFDSPRFDLVIASCGGYPKDINFIQSHKAIHNAAMFVRDGGLLILYAECRDGVGSRTFLPWFEKGSFAKAFCDISCRYEGNGGTTLAMMIKLKRIHIGMVTQLDEDICRLIGVEGWGHNQVCAYLTSLKDDNSVALIPNASLVVKKVRTF
jgi:lactate racemase